jgi:RNA polymerase sigma factor for flagellar operon FliA
LCGSTARATGTFDDLVSAGMVGLLNAYDAFDATRGAAFTTYAHPRVRGAVLDELRRQDFVPRSVRRKRRVVADARSAVKARANGQSTEAQVAVELGVDLPTLWSWELDAEWGVSEPLDTLPGHGSATACHASESWTNHQVAVDVQMERAEDMELVREALARMPEQERLVLILYFYEDLKLRQIGEIIGVSESRVSQIRTRAMTRLRKELVAAAA